MKKSFRLAAALALCLLTAFTAAACGEGNNVDPTSQTDTQKTETTISENATVQQDWIEKNDRTMTDEKPFDEIRITQIYPDYFIAATVDPTPYQIRLNGSLPDEWKVGDQALCDYDNAYYDDQTGRFEADLISLVKSTP